ncbi:glycosyltransferase family 4 protein [Coleofasciculus sp. FACHB-64]|uniref:glycosyltransferase family 4 protein n=1 Tax=Cyanophyceae TaxID=3028117 RepID=UPI001686FD30|nr:MULTISPECIES: glycosyltransferase family 4 protein [unclassified Coleofasciculus]MBD1840933.1 glycosyltransferase family 4 protein [Coleofasciculus sp. FACHB-501]MBD2046056.1 glycosyltransferase family 4 protein [Coleofasciculus sp. FACHB-64]
MHIGFVTTTFPPDNGWDGIGSYVFHMSRGLVSLGHQVTVICGFGKEPRESSENGLRIIRGLNTQRANVQNLQAQAFKLLVQVIQEHNLDVVEFPEYSALGLEFQRHYPNFPTVVKLHGDSQLCRLGAAPLLKRWTIQLDYQIRPNLLAQMERETIARADAVVSPSTWLMQQCLKRRWYLPKSRYIIANPFGGWVYEPDFLSEKDYTIPRVVSLGRLDFLKGAAQMPSIFRSVWQELPETCFEVLGQSIPRKDGSNWGDWLISRISKEHHSQVAIRGGIPYLDLPSYLNKHSVGFFASTWESFGYTHVECMYAGIACVIGSNGGAQELGINGVSCLNTSRTGENIAKGLVKLLKNSALRRTISETARQHVLNKYSPTGIANQMTEVYQRTIQRGQSQ